jgi:serine/alanine adding enzyme
MNVEVWSKPAPWDAYVAGTAGASNYHRWAWKDIIEGTYGHKGYYLAAVSDGAIQGILPLFAMKSRIFGHFLISIPFFSYGGVLASTVEARQSLLTRAIELAKQLGARRIELRQEDPSDFGWQLTSAKVAMQVVLPSNTDELWKRLSSRLRNKVRHAQKQGLRAEWGGSEVIDSFYPVFASNMRNLGTPVYPRRWFENVFRHTPADARILLVLDNGKPVATTFVSGFREVLELPWIASVPEGRRNYATELLYWTSLEWAAEKGYRRVDLGRCTPGAGVYRFKKQWICEEKPLQWHHWLKPGEPVPHLHADNPKFQWAISVWKRLPLPIANWIGPYIVRSIP